MKMSAMNIDEIIPFLQEICKLAQLKRYIDNIDVYKEDMAWERIKKNIKNLYAECTVIDVDKLISSGVPKLYSIINSYSNRIWISGNSFWSSEYENIINDLLIFYDNVNLIIYSILNDHWDKLTKLEEDEINTDFKIEPGYVNELIMEYYNSIKEYNINLIDNY